jgi:hypothetical protein
MTFEFYCLRNLNISIGDVTFVYMYRPLLLQSDLFPIIDNRSRRKYGSTQLILATWQVASQSSLGLGHSRESR